MPQAMGFVSANGLIPFDLAASAQASAGPPRSPARSESGRSMKQERSPGEVVIRTRIFVGGLNETINEDDLRNLFGTFGEIQEVLIKDRGGKDESRRGHAFITYKTTQMADKAIQEGKGEVLELKGVRLNVCPARRRGPKDQPTTPKKENVEPAGLERTPPPVAVLPPFGICPTARTFGYYSPPGTNYAGYMMPHHCGPQCGHYHGLPSAWAHLSYPPSPPFPISPPHYDGYTYTNLSAYGPIPESPVHVPRERYAASMSIPNHQTQYERGMTWNNSMQQGDGQYRNANYRDIGCGCDHEPRSATLRPTKMMEDLAREPRSLDRLRPPVSSRNPYEVDAEFRSFR